MYEFRRNSLEPFSYLMVMTNRFFRLIYASMYRLIMRWHESGMFYFYRGVIDLKRKPSDVRFVIHKSWKEWIPISTENKYVFRFMDGYVLEIQDIKYYESPVYYKYERGKFIRQVVKHIPIPEGGDQVLYETLGLDRVKVELPREDYAWLLSSEPKLTTIRGGKK